jgi:hypothetical protein
VIKVRLKQLKAQIKLRRGRKAELEYDLETPPQEPDHEDLEKIRVAIREVLSQDTPRVRKALYEALIHEITIVADDTVRPTFKLPLSSDNDEGPVLDGPAPVRALTTSVGRTGIEPPSPRLTPSPADSMHRLIDGLGRIVAPAARRQPVQFSPPQRLVSDRTPRTDDALGHLIRELTQALEETLDVEQLQG